VAPFQARAKDIYLLQTGSAAHPASYMMGREALSTGIKRSGSKADHSSPLSAELKNGGSMSPLPHTPSWPGA
jgi:hypothetical protein